MAMTRLLVGAYGLYARISVAAPAPARPLAIPSTAASAWRWLVRHSEIFWVAAILLVAGMAVGINMFHFPYYENDEGTYISQAWAVLREAQLAPYTYWYDHAPVGWMQLAIWSALTGGFHDFTLTIAGGRVMMLFMQVGSTLLVYAIARRISGSIAVGSVAALLFALSPFGIYFHRRVLLDNFTTFWMLVSILLLLSPHLTLRKIWLSAVALGISVLSKELTVFLIPVLAFMVFSRADRAHRRFAVVGWLAIVISLLSLYILMAVLKGELFPTGTLLGGKNDHVSLIGSLQYQTSRGKDGGILQPTSRFWFWVRIWMGEEPVLFTGGCIAMFLSIAVIWRWRIIGIMGLTTLSLMLFLARGGEVIEFYLVPYLALFAINIALVFGLVLRGINVVVGRWLHLPRLALGVGVAAAALCASAILLDYTVPWQGLAGNHLIFWQSTQADAQTSAVAWVRAHVPPKDNVLIDDYMYLDLHDSGGRGPNFTGAQWYWKVDQKQDKAVARLVPSWRAFSYAVVTPQMTGDAQRTDLTKVMATVAHSVVVAHFDTGGWPVDIRQVVTPGHPTPHNTLPIGTQFYFAGGENSAGARSTLFLRNPAIYPASVTITFYFPNGATDVQGVQVDPSSDLQVNVADFERTSGPFGMAVRASLPVAAHLTIHRRGTAGDSLIVDKGLATHWSLSENYSGMTGGETLSLLNPDPTLAAHVTVRTIALSGATSPARAIAVPSHSSVRIPLVPIEARDVEVQSDRPIAAERTVQFSAAGYQMMAKGAGSGEQAGWLFASGPSGGTLTFYNPGCAAALAVSPSNGRQLVASGCRDARVLPRFLQAGPLTAPAPAPAQARGSAPDSPPGG